MPKNTWKEQQKRLDWCRRYLNKYWHNIFFADEATVYVYNSSGYKWVKKMKSMLNTNNKMRGQKLNLWGTISANWKKLFKYFKKTLKQKNI